MKYYFFTFSIFCATVALAQTKPFKISGILISEADKTPLEFNASSFKTKKDANIEDLLNQIRTQNVWLQKTISKIYKVLF